MRSPLFCSVPSPPSPRSYLGLGLQTAKEGSLPMLIHECKACVSHALHGLPVDIPVATGRLEESQELGK